MKISFFVLFRFQLISRGAQLGLIGDLCSIWGSILLFWFRSRTLIVFGCCNAILVLCEVAIVSQPCIPFPYVLHGLCEDYLTYDCFQCGYASKSCFDSWEI